MEMNGNETDRNKQREHRGKKDDDDTQRSPSNRRECRGHNPAKKSVRTGAACSVGKACLYLHTIKLTVCSTSDRLEKHMGK